MLSAILRIAFRSPSMTILSIGYPIRSETPSITAVISSHSMWQTRLPLANRPVTVPSSFQVRKRRE